MHDRIQRYVIPATIVLMTAVLTVLVGTQGIKGTDVWRGLTAAGNSGIISAIITVAITNLGLGYVCHAIFCAVMFRQKERIVDRGRLLQAFGLKTQSLCSHQLEALLGEFHLRFHTTAPESLREHCTRRNSAWYIAKTCAIAVIVGLAVAAFYVWSQPDLKVCWLPSSIWVVLMLAFSGMSWNVGTRWNKEFWEVAWGWIAGDVKEHPLCDNWLKRNGLTRLETNA